MTMHKSKTIVIDFDGTVVSHRFPLIGRDIGAVPVLKKLVARGHKLILFTMRSDVENVPPPEFEGTFPGTYLTDAIEWFTQNEIPLYGVQTNPTQHRWTTSPKAFGHYYIDDMALGTPLIYDLGEPRPYVDWSEIEKMLISEKLITGYE